jgi:hypothetical protein
MYETTTLGIAAVIAGVIAVLMSILIIDGLSRLTGRDSQNDIESVIALLEAVKTAFEDGKVTAEEYEEIKEALLLAKNNIRPYLTLIAESGILQAIWNRLNRR